MIFKTILFSLLTLVSACEIQAGKPNHLAPAKPVTLDQYKPGLNGSRQPDASGLPAWITPELLPRYPKLPKWERRQRARRFIPDAESHAAYERGEIPDSFLGVPTDRNGNACQIGTCWDENGRELNR